MAPEVFARKHDVLLRHCDDAGRDPSEIAISMNLPLAWTTGSLEAQFGALTDAVRPSVLTGSEQEVLDRIGCYEEAGVGQINLALRAPFDLDGVERFAALVGLSPS